ncbi:MAG: hypothetical protein HRT99_02120 [Mycoplasmatales bacterium]|nr:hypothetical protein [Mycoplasmatales bacterium]
MFSRKMNLITRELMNKQYSNYFNEKNLPELSRKKIDNIFKNETRKHRTEYIHYVLDKWFLDKPCNIKTIKELKSIIKKCNLKLNQIEIHNLELINERIFSIDRHIKKLEVSNELMKKENVWVKFERAEIYEYKNHLKTLLIGTLLLTNFRIIFIDDNNEISYYWKEIKKIEYLNYGFKFSFKRKTYLIRIHDQITLNNTIKNFANKRLKYEIT